MNNLPFPEEKIDDHLKHLEEQHLYTILNFQIFPSFCQHQKTQSEHEMNCCCFNPLPFTFALLDWTEIFQYLQMACFLHEGLKMLLYIVTFGDVIDQTKDTKKTLLSPKLSPSDKSIIQAQLNRSYNQFTFKIFEKNQFFLN